MCGTTDQWSIHATDQRNLYIPKQKSSSYLSHAISLLNNHLYELLVDLIWLKVSDMSRLTFQSVSVCNRFQEV